MYLKKIINCQIQKHISIIVKLTIVLKKHCKMQNKFSILYYH